MLEQLPLALAGRRGSGSVVKTEPSGLTVGVPHAGQRRGRARRPARGPRARRRAAPGETTCGMTSPARRTITSSPTRMSLRARSSSLCSVASFTVTPPTCTGSSTANGCRSPNLPTFHSMSCSVVTFVVGGNFQAIAQRGSRPTTPSRRCSSRSSTLTTTPSISKSSAPRRSCHARHCFTTASSSSQHLDVAVDAEAVRRSHSRPSWCDVERHALGRGRCRSTTCSAGARPRASGRAGGSCRPPSCAGS